jgi:NAD-dependent deacetylase
VATASLDEQVATVAQWVRAGGPRSLMALTGAGVSTDSGIPDYRGPNGVWTRDPTAAATVTIDSYVADPDVRRRAWRERSAHSAWTAQPNPAHAALVDLQRSGWLGCLATQNIDGLHQSAGTTEDVLLELHGTIWRSVCLSCGDRGPMAQVLDRVRAGEADPSCRACGGILKSDTVSFGQSLDPTVIAEASRAARTCGVLLAAGTSLQVNPAAGLCDIAARAGARLVVCNAAPTPYDPVADLVMRVPVAEALPALAQELCPGP